MIPTPFTPRSTTPQVQMPPPPTDITQSFLWMDQFSQNQLLTVQALQRLQAAFEAKFWG